MHEMALAEGVLRIVEDAAAQHAAARVHTIWLELGALAHVEPEALRFCLESVTRGSVAEGATLTIERTPGVAWCMPCSARVPVAELGEACPQCGSYQLQVTAGEAMRVREIGIV